MLKIFFTLVVSYLLGSMPFSHIFPKLKGKDVSQEGTKNIGATNVLVVAGPLLGFLALVGDVAKGYLAVSLGQSLGLPPLALALAGAAAVLGHDFSVFLGFKGGKGIATIGGCLLAFDPILTIIIVLLWVMLIIFWRYFIPSTMVMLTALPILLLVLGKGLDLVVFSVLAWFLAVYTHRDDIKRFLAGQELKTSESISRYWKK